MSEVDADEPVIDTLTIALAEGFEDGCFMRTDTSATWRGLQHST